MRSAKSTSDGRYCWRTGRVNAARTPVVDYSRVRVGNLPTERASAATTFTSSHVGNSGKGILRVSIRVPRSRCGINCGIKTDSLIVELVMGCQAKLPGWLS